jgi:hypothetical protein
MHVAVVQAVGHERLIPHVNEPRSPSLSQRSQSASRESAGSKPPTSRTIAAFARTADGGTTNVRYSMRDADEAPLSGRTTRRSDPPRATATTGLRMKDSSPEAASNCARR